MPSSTPASNLRTGGRGWNQGVYDDLASITGQGSDSAWRVATARFATERDARVKHSSLRRLRAAIRRGGSYGIRRTDRISAGIGSMRQKVRAELDTSLRNGAASVGPTWPGRHAQ